MKKLIKSIAFVSSLFLLANSATVNAKQLRVAVIDTGVDLLAIDKLCKDGHQSFIDYSPLIDTDGHGTHVAGLIQANSGEDSNYCIVSLKYYKPDVHYKKIIKATKLAFEEAIKLKVDVINMSGGGPSSDEDERKVVLKALDAGITIIAAAGNEATNLDKSCDYFPACYDSRIIVVGNLREDGSRSPLSNYGKYVKRWEVGTNVLSTLPGYDNHGYKTGTSQAAAIVTGKFIKSRLTK